jgi:hypothetical protein
MQELKMIYKLVYTVTWSLKVRILEPSRRPLLDNGSVSTFPLRRNNVATPLLGQQIFVKEPVAGRRKHISVETVFSQSLTRGLQDS